MRTAQWRRGTGKSGWRSCPTMACQPSPAPAKSARPFPDRLECPAVVRLPGLARRIAHVVPEEPEVIPAVFDAVVCPPFGQPPRKCAKLERPDVAVVPGLPGSQVLDDAGVGNAGFLVQLA